MLDGGNTGVSIFNLITIGAVEMLSDIDKAILVLAKNNTQAIAHPFWSALGAYIDDSKAEALTCTDDDDSDDCLSNPICDLTLEFDDLDALLAANGTFPHICDAYAVGALSKMLNTTMANFTLVNDGYDQVFGEYVTYVKEMIPEAIYEFMIDPTDNSPAGGPGNKYFTCIFEEGLQNRTSQPCPVDSRSLSDNIYTVYYTLINSDRFFAELELTYGIKSDWITFRSTNFSPHDFTGYSSAIDQGREGYPLPASNFTVPNPKDTISNAMPQITNLTRVIYSTQIELNLGSWYGLLDDVVQVLSTPVFMVMQAVDSM